jgi:hypothetical protein
MNFRGWSFKAVGTGSNDGLLGLVYKKKKIFFI